MRRRAGVDDDVIVGARQRIDRRSSAAPTMTTAAASAPARPAAITCTREKRSRVMIWPNDAVPRTRSAMPGARGSVRDRREVRPVERKIDQHRRARRAPASRASATAVSVVPMPAAAPITAIALADLARLAQRLRHSAMVSSSGRLRRRGRGCGAGGRGRHCGCALRLARASSAAASAASRRHRGAARRSTGAAGHDAAPRRNRAARRGRLDRRAFGAIDVAGEQLAGGDEAGRDEQRRERRDQHDRQLLREIRRVRHDRARDDARIGRHRAEAVARGRLAILGEIGFEQIALRLGLALQRAQLHVLPAGRGRLLLELVEAAR